MLPGESPCWQDQFYALHSTKYVTTILYIEDNEAIRQLVRLILARRKDIELLEAETGSDGLDLALSRLPDLLLIDITLPDMPGGEVLRRLRHNPLTAAIPAIAISGNAVDTTRNTSPGFNDYLAKPIDIATLYKTIDALLS